MVEYRVVFMTPYHVSHVWWLPRQALTVLVLYCHMLMKASLKLTPSLYSSLPQEQEEKNKQSWQCQSCACKRHGIGITEGKDHLKDSNTMSEQQDRSSSDCCSSSNLVHRTYHSRNCVCRKDAFCATAISIK